MARNIGILCHTKKNRSFSRRNIKWSQFRVKWFEAKRKIAWNKKRTQDLFTRAQVATCFGKRCSVYIHWNFYFHESDKREILLFRPFFFLSKFTWLWYHPWAKLLFFVRSASGILLWLVHVFHLLLNYAIFSTGAHLWPKKRQKSYHFFCCCYTRGSLAATLIHSPWTNGCF